MVPGGLAAAVLAAAAAEAPPPIEPVRSAYRSGDVGRYEVVMYGEPMYWSLAFIVGEEVGEPPPRNRSILTRGVLNVLMQPKADPEVRLCTEDGRPCLALDRPVQEIGAEFFADAPFRNGHEAQVVGAFVDGGGFLFWSLDTGEPRARGAALGPDRRLEDLVTRPDRHLGRDVTVRGRFRGANLFADFPSEAGRGKDGWVLRDGPFSVWITGRAPRGEGFKLDVRSVADCVYKVEVEGRVEPLGDAVAIAARRVRLLGRDADTSCASQAAR